MLFFPDFSTVIRGAPRLDAGAPRLVAGAPRLLAGAPWLLTSAPRLVTGAPRLDAGAPRCSQACRRRSQAYRRRFQVIPGASNVLSSAPRYSQTYHNHSNGTPVAVIRDPSYSEGRPECPPRVWYSPEIDSSKFTLHILSDTPGVFQWLKYILLTERIRIEPTNWRFIQCDTRWGTAATQTPLSPPRCCRCSLSKYYPGCTFQKCLYNRK